MFYLLLFLLLYNAIEYVMVIKIGVLSNKQFQVSSILYNYRLLMRSIRVFVDLIKAISTEDVVLGRYHFYQFDKNTY